ncbi:MAG: hypothetical protein WC397_01420 [Candidatus Paceibacterota bacterium]|jgi:hypothetical protein
MRAYPAYFLEGSPANSLGEDMKGQKIQKLVEAIVFLSYPLARKR